MVRDEPEAHGRPGASVPLVVALAAVALAVVAGVSMAVRAPLARIPAAERPAVVERAVANLRGVCRAADRPRDFCAEQAKLLAGRPECDADCRAAVQGELEADTAVR